MSKYKGPLPSKSQIKYFEDELACFMHFGMNTYTDKEWGDGKESPSNFSLKEFDYDDYVKFIKEMGFKRLIFTAKHHDGFCMFDTKFSDHNIMNTDYGKDFLLELSKACTKYDMDMGVYLSPWDAHEKSYGTGKAYNDFYANQIQEICENPNYGNNGKFVEWWFDNAKDPNFIDQEYDFDRWIEIVRKNNPDILMFGVGARGGIHWIGNEKGYSPEENAPRIHKSIMDNDIDYENSFKSSEGHDENHVFSIPEADTTTTDGWFYHDNEKLKSVDELFKVYLKSVGNSSVLLLNIAPNKSGEISEELKSRVRDFIYKVREEFSRDKSHLFEISREENEKETIIKIRNTKNIDVSYIVLSEKIECGSRFKNGYIEIDGNKIEIPSLGYKKIVSINDYGYKSFNDAIIHLSGCEGIFVNQIKLY